MRQILYDPMGTDRDLSWTCWDFVPDNLLDVIKAVKVLRKFPLVAMSYGAIDSCHYQIKVVLNIRSGRVCPHKRNLQRQPSVCFRLG